MMGYLIKHMFEMGLADKSLTEKVVRAFRVQLRVVFAFEEVGYAWNPYFLATHLEQSVVRQVV